MMFRVHLPHVVATAIAGLVCSPAFCAEDGVQAELKALRQIVELQSKQIEVLSAQIARLNAAFGPHSDPGATATAPAQLTVSPAVETAEAPILAARSVAPPRDVHIVVKGESLEKIAKAHGATALDIQKLNHISDPKKLQIGQQLILPTTTLKKEGQ